MTQRRFIAHATSRKGAAADAAAGPCPGPAGGVAAPMSLCASLRYLQGEASLAGQALVALLLGAAALAAAEVDALRRVPRRRGRRPKRGEADGLRGCIALLRAEAAALPDPTARRVLDAALLCLAREDTGISSARALSARRASIL
ncbi:MAG: hypothetical protein JNK11_10395 [Alphaproteobacteria bacterium]|nr:hypothetical protein [Alphaproteobacteria bacterium]